MNLMLLLLRLFMEKIQVKVSPLSLPLSKLDAYCLRERTVILCMHESSSRAAESPNHSASTSGTGKSSMLACTCAASSQATDSLQRKEAVVQSSKDAPLD